MNAQYVFFNRFLGRSRPEVEKRIAEHMLATQRADGSWALFDNGPAHLSATIEAYAALQLAGRRRG